MKNKDKIRKILNRLETAEDRAMGRVADFENEIANLTRKVKEEVRVKTLADVNDELSRFKKKIDLEPILSSFQLVRGDFNSTYQELSANFQVAYEKIIQRFEEGIRRLQDIESRTEAKTTSLFNELKSLGKDIESKSDSSRVSYMREQERRQESFESSIRPLVEDMGDKLIKTKNSVKEEISLIKKDIKDMSNLFGEFRSTLMSQIASQSRGGSMNRQIKVGGVNYLTRYTDINLIGSITAVNNDTERRVDITFAGGGGATIETPVGAVDANNVTFTVTDTPQYIVSDGVTYFENNGYTLSGLTVTMDIPPSNYIRAAI